MHGKYADVMNVMQKTALGFPVGLPRTGRVWLPSKDSKIIIQYVVFLQSLNSGGFEVIIGGRFHIRIDGWIWA